MTTFNPEEFLQRLTNFFVNFQIIDEQDFLQVLQNHTFAWKELKNTKSYELFENECALLRKYLAMLMSKNISNIGYVWINCPIIPKAMELMLPQRVEEISIKVTVSDSLLDAAVFFEKLSNPASADKELRLVHSELFEKEGELLKIYLSLILSGQTGSVAQARKDFPLLVTKIERLSSQPNLPQGSKDMGQSRMGIRTSVPP